MIQMVLKSYFFIFFFYYLLIQTYLILGHILDHKDILPLTLGFFMGCGQITIFAFVIISLSVIAMMGILIFMS